AACLALALLALSAADDMKDYGYPKWKCDAEVMKKSKTVPTSVHSLRYADINVIAALGDSLTAANGAGAEPHDVLGVAIQYRGLAWSMGGDKSLEEHVTLTNILKKFNPDIFGYSIRTGSANVWETAHLNTAIPGAKSHMLMEQATDLVRRMKEHPTEVDIENDWKLVHIFIGANDVCEWCGRPDTLSSDDFRDNLEAAIQILKDNLPRTVVVLVGLVDVSLLRVSDADKKFCELTHLIECHCEENTKVDIPSETKKYQAAEQELVDGRFDTADDFTLVIQPFFEETDHLPLMPNGEPDFTFFAPDCFHFSQFGHGVVGKTLWNNMLQPVGMKDRSVNLTDLTPPLNCPEKACPFIRTSKNSVNCAPYMTPAAN
ncbi:hypothetical protein PENTCL1PPCAC_15335, partial [Pristionchus entomophagus]